MASTADLIRDALLELAVQDPIDPTDPALLSLGLVRFNSLIDLANAEQIATYAVTFPTFSTTSGLSPHTIGPTGATWTVTQRPVAILAANRLQGSGVTLVRIPINIRDKAWWMAQSTPNVQDGIPTDLFYDPTWDNGSVYLWPVPDAVFTIELMVRLVLSQVTAATITTTLSMPPAMYRWLMLTLAEDLCTPLSQTWTPTQAKKLAKATTAYFGNNNPPIRIATRDSGMPSGSRGPSACFNWRSRQTS